MKQRLIKKRLFLWLTCLTLCMSGCGKTPVEDNITGTPTPSPTPEGSFVEATESSNIAENGNNENILIETKDSQGNVTEKIEYLAETDTTTIYFYEYNEFGELHREVSFDAPGNKVEAFVAGDYEQATGSGEINYYLMTQSSLTDADVAEAFNVTIEELAPLYQQAGEIYDNYGVVVLIADKIHSMEEGAEFCYDYDQIQSSLDLVESCLTCYPDGFFRDFSEDNARRIVCIQLVGAGSSAGIYYGGHKYLLIQLDVNNYSVSKEYDDKGEFFCYTLHHEISHMICDVLVTRAENSSCPLTEEQWNSYNPKGFEYVYGYDDEKEMAIYDTNYNYEYFISSYGCSTPEEDRASIFGDAMVYYQGYECMKFTEQVEAKLRYYSDCIKAGFHSDNWPDTAPWEVIIN